jgi:L-xylulokinase
MFADILQVPVEVTAGSELGTLGAAVGAAVAAGCYRSYEAACEAMVRIARTCEPNRQWADLYQSKYERYNQVLDIMAPVWSDLVWRK